jgi:hypothetical protein
MAYGFPAQRFFFFGKPLALVAILVGLCTVPALAELGGSVDTVQSDQQRMKGTVRVTTAPTHTMHEIQTESGTTVREFVSPAGTVFGVAWQGPFTPDLRQLLGTYYDQFAQAAAQPRRARRAPLIIRESGLVVEAGGHMRSFRGRAYIEQLVPQGMDANAIK